MAFLIIKGNLIAHPFSYLRRILTVNNEFIVIGFHEKSAPAIKRERFLTHLFF